MAVVTVAQQKGGAGKTTLAAHLAVAFRQAGRTVATVDIDPQGSLTRWHEIRAEHMQDIDHSRIQGWRTAQEVDRLSRRHDMVVIDSPPHAETEAKIAISKASLVLLPVQPSPMDVWATQPTLDLAAKEKVPVLVVMNRVPPRSSLADELTETISAMGVPVAETRIGNRVSLASALMSGRSVTEGHRSRASDEIRALAAEVLARIR
ncbi:MAG: ParA family protein [Rhodospirillaceae bacterium]|nr:ParA family protein [Rhodospirillaceae bacterium]